MDEPDKTEADRRRLVANERIKATVNLINSVADTMIAVLLSNLLIFQLGRHFEASAPCCH